LTVASALREAVPKRATSPACWIIAPRLDGQWPGRSVYARWSGGPPSIGCPFPGLPEFTHALSALSAVRLGQRGNRTGEFARAFERLSTGVPLRPFRLMDT